MSTQSSFPALENYLRDGVSGHGHRLGLLYRMHGPDWVELGLPYSPEQIGDPESGVIASGPILSMMDMATSLSVWLVIGRGECYRITRSIAFVRGQAHDGDPDDPLAHVAGTFMALEGYR